MLGHAPSTERMPSDSCPDHHRLHACCSHFVAGKRGSLLLRLRDDHASEARLSDRAHPLQVGLTTSDTIVAEDVHAMYVCEVLDQGGGTYSASFLLLRSGWYSAHAWLHGKALLSSLPFRVKPGALSPLRCTAFGAGLTRAKMGSPAHLWIEARDACGNRLEAGGESWRVRIEPHEAEAAVNTCHPAVSIRDCKDGRYCVSYCFPLSGRFQLHVGLVRGRGDVIELAVSPWSLTVEPSDVHPPNCVVQAEFISTPPVAGELCFGWLQAVDVCQRPLPSAALLEELDGKIVAGQGRRECARLLGTKDWVMLHSEALQAVWRLRPE
ncbi:MAG: hypothetical protein SGPRY_012930, partial [Prymnesium sp.]